MLLVCFKVLVTKNISDFLELLVYLLLLLLLFKVLYKGEDTIVFDFSLEQVSIDLYLNRVTSMTDRCF